VPLLLPLTVGIEFEQSTKFEETKKRALSVSVDPLSLMLSNQDVRLVRAVIDAWVSSANPPSRSVSSRNVLFDVEFRSQRLGLGLKKENGKIVVDNIADSIQSDLVEIGDALHAINGKEIVNAETITLAEMVNRLVVEPRPLRIAFSRVVDSPGDDGEIGRNAALTLGSDARLGVEDTIDVSLSSAVVTVVEKEVPIFRGSITTTKAVCRLVRSQGKEISIDVSTALRIEYYNLGIWAWEPFVEPSVLYLSSSFEEVSGRPRELAVEFGDRDDGVCINVTDALFETLAKAVDWIENDIESFGTPMLQEQTEDDASLSSAERRDMISRRAANEAYRFASKQKIGTAKPFLFRNRTGLSVAFVKQSPYDDTAESHPSEALVAVGEYHGLQRYESSEITVVGNDEELKFYVDVNLCDPTRNGQTDGSGLKQFPLLTVALQESNMAVAAPFVDLQIAQVDEATFPMRLSKRLGNDDYPAPRNWMSWLVEHEDEKTVLTIGSTIRFLSLLNQTVEMNMEELTQLSEQVTSAPASRTVVLRAGDPFCFPIWIAMQENSWRCSVRIAPDYCFSPLATVSPNGSVEFHVTPFNSVECASTVNGGSSAWLTVTRQEDKGVLTISIDSSISVRNLLPASIDWEVMESSPERESLVDGSTVREMRLGSPHPLKSGAYAEVLTNGGQMNRFRVRPANRSCDWSKWTPISFSSNRDAKKNGKSEDTDDDRITVAVLDEHQATLPLGIRFARKASGIDVSVYTELWLVNMTALDVLFGYPKNRTLQKLNAAGSEETKSTEMSVAEATLKEITSLFDVGDPISANTDNIPRDVVRLSGQVATYIPDECFEYVEMENSVELHHWWASANPFSKRGDITSTNGSKIETHWVRLRSSGAGKTIRRLILLFSSTGC
jgi:hypothetical protein